MSLFQAPCRKREAEIPAGDPEEGGRDGGERQAEEDQQRQEGRHGEAGLHRQDEEHPRHADGGAQGRTRFSDVVSFMAFDVKLNCCVA